MDAKTIEAARAAGEAVIALKAAAPAVFDSKTTWMGHPAGLLLVPEPDSEGWRLAERAPVPSNASAHERLEAEAWLSDLTGALRAAASPLPVATARALGLSLRLSVRRNGGRSESVRVWVENTCVEGSGNEVAARNLSDRFAEISALASFPAAAELLSKPPGKEKWQVIVGFPGPKGKGRTTRTAAVSSDDATGAARLGLLVCGLVSRLDGAPAALEDLVMLSCVRTFHPLDSRRIAASFGPGWSPPRRGLKATGRRGC